MRSFLCYVLVLWLMPVVHARTVSDAIEPAKTYVFISGVLNWEHPSLSSFSDRNRKDEELYRLFLKQGIPADQIVFLKDQQATQERMDTRLKQLLARTDGSSTFIFYYAGHGVRSGNGPVSFANYDYRPGQGFPVSRVTTAIQSLFKGKAVWLMADCCYSGVLMEEGKRIAAPGRSVIVFTSSSGSNISTANWTFTQTIIDCLSGLPRGDRNADGRISLREVRAELFDAMKYREKQLSGTAFYQTDEEASFNLIPVEALSVPTATSYLYVMQGSRFEPARILARSGQTVTAELFRYSDRSTVTLPLTQTKPIDFAEYPVGKTVQVEWNGATFPAVIRDTKDGFHYIHYTGYDDSWNEWVVYDRILADRKRCQIEWRGQWYPGELLQEGTGRYFVHYAGYGSDWDEWVGKERIRL